MPTQFTVVKSIGLRPPELEITVWLLIIIYVIGQYIGKLIASLKILPILVFCLFTGTAIAYSLHPVRFASAVQPTIKI